jgi:hypothetical protein
MEQYGLSAGALRSLQVVYKPNPYGVNLPPMRLYSREKVAGYTAAKQAEKEAQKLQAAHQRAQVKAQKEAAKPKVWTEKERHEAAAARAKRYEKLTKSPAAEPELVKAESVEVPVSKKRVKAAKKAVSAKRTKTR